MSGILAIGMGGSSTAASVRFAVDYWSYSTYDFYSEKYGYDPLALSGNALSDVVFDPAWNGRTVRALYTSYESSSEDTGLVLALDGITSTAPTPTTLEAGGLSYPLTPSGQQWRTSSTVTFTASPSNNVNWTAHGLSANNPVSFAGTLPSGLTAGTTYFVQSVVDANTFKVSSTVGGAIITITGTGSGTRTGYKNPFVNYGGTPSTGNVFGTITPRTVSIPGSSGGAFSATNHGLNNGDMISLKTTGTLPSPLTVDTLYYVIDATSSTFNVSATPGGSPISVSWTGTGMHTMFQIATVKVR